MNVVIPIASTKISQSSGPQETKTAQAKIDAIIDFASKVKNWPLVEEAVDAKIEDQEEFVGWWDEKVGSRHGGDRSKISDTEILTMSADAATAATGITPLQVSRWRKGLRDKIKYREKMIVAAYRKAELVPAENHRAEGTGDNQWFTPVQYIEAARLARVSRPDVRVVFTGAPRYRDFARGLGEFIEEPVNAAHVGMIIGWLS